jgi:hypothetical protein
MRTSSQSEFGIEYGKHIWSPVLFLPEIATW